MPVKKETSSTVKKVPVKRAPRAKSTPKKTAPNTHQVAKNARHIDENTRKIKSNSNMVHIMYGIIIVLMIIIAALAYYVGTLSGTSNNNITNTPGYTELNDMTITIIDDKRCSDCSTNTIADQLKLLPFLAGATFVEKDFSEKGIADFMKENKLLTIPVVVFSSNSLNDGGQIAPHLTTLPDGQFSLALAGTFNPFAERSENGFLILDTQILQDIKQGAYIEGRLDTPITWIEYSDLECPFCAKLHNEGTPKAILEKYSDDVNIIFQHFPLDFHDEALAGAQALECIAEQDPDAFYTLISESYKIYSNNNFSLSGFYDLAAKAGINKIELESCVDSEKYKEKVESQMSLGQNVFGITGTPGNVIINNTTGEYQVISGAYPVGDFEAIIDKLLK